jgi:CobW/HypB/UreG, nucleotide-binding domain
VSTERPLLVLVGGFLGSGKSTLLLEAAARLTRTGLRVALITNDQGGALVDTRMAISSGAETDEIVGGCFCCRFSDLMDSAERLRAHAPDFILAEPVGSCIDISATVLQPIKRDYGDRYRLAPFTVLVDPQRAQELLAAGADRDLAYLFTNQLAEADLVCFSKADLYTEFPELPSGPASRLSSITGQGVSEWLREVLGGTGQAGGRLLEDVDYGQYAEAEAALGWLNWEANIRLKEPLSPAAVVGPLLDDLDALLSRHGVSIVHLKIFDQAPTGYLKANLCRNGDEPFVDGALDASPAQRHNLLLNLRASGAPELLEALVIQATGKLPGEITVLHSESFRPAAPRPEYRITSITAVPGDVPVLKMEVLQT